MHGGCSQQPSPEQQLSHHIILVSRNRPPLSPGGHGISGFFRLLLPSPIEHHHPSSPSALPILQVSAVRLSNNAKRRHRSSKSFRLPLPASVPWVAFVEAQSVLCVRWVTWVKISGSPFGSVGFSGSSRCLRIHSSPTYLRLLTLFVAGRLASGADPSDKTLSLWLAQVRGCGNDGRHPSYITAPSYP